MATASANKLLSLYEGTDLVSRAAQVGNLESIDASCAHQTALQTNTSTTAYTTDAPFTGYFDDMRFVFLPLYANTGAATLNVNTLGAKKLCDGTSGIQISAAGAIAVRRLYWLDYDPTLDSGNGGFRVWSVWPDAPSDYVHRTGEVDEGIDGDKTFNDPIIAADSLDPIHGAKFRITPGGGFAVRLKNKTGHDTIKGELVTASTGTDEAFMDGAYVGGRCSGVTYEDGVADGNEAHVIMVGRGQVRLKNDVAATRGYWGYQDNATPRRVNSASSAPGGFMFVCFFLESVASSPTGCLAEAAISLRWA